MTDVSAIGVVDPAFFVGRQVLLRWVNSFFKLEYTKVEQAASGALHCQILDACFPGKVPMHKVNFNARQEYEFTNNWKIFQQVFAKLGIAKHVPVEKLILGKFQDNLEMLQWMKALFDAKYSGEPYDAEARRKGKVAGAIAGGGGGGSSSSTTVEPTSKTARRRTSNDVGKVKPAAVAAAAAGGTAAVGSERKVPKPAARAPLRVVNNRASGGVTGTARRKKVEPPAVKRASPHSARVEKLEQEVSRLTATVMDVEKERDFYLDKLREIEILCQQDEEVESALKAEVLRILYATDENDEFQAPSDSQLEEAEAGYEQEAAADEAQDMAQADGYGAANNHTDNADFLGGLESNLAF